MLLYIKACVVLNSGNSACSHVSQAYLLIDSLPSEFKDYLLSTYYVSDSLADIGNIAANKVAKVPPLKDIYFNGETENTPLSNKETSK